MSQPRTTTIASPPVSRVQRLSPLRGAPRALVAAAAVLLSSCSVGGSDRPLPRLQHARVDVTLSEYRIDFKSPIPAGRVVVRVLNAGREVHRLKLLPLPEDLPPLDKQLRGRTRRAVAPLAGIPSLRPGSTNSFAVDLGAGRRYGFVDFTRTPQGRSAALLGMNAEFRAGRGPKPGRLVAP